ncbi:hypothetical protein CCR75_003488 [Bremia lactucae]|uniref:AFG1-like ATPase n=1 Tax=Bremia lactucae TaxID=4779 RepID=A0A976FQG0_BRELC|nr:hypothetical protein CCR75_003488 [Bremia lactucae]
MLLRRNNLRGIRSHARWLHSLPRSCPKPSETYDALVQSHEVTFDAKQAAIVRHYLDPLHVHLNGYKLPSFEPLSNSNDANPSSKTYSIPKGLYIYGDVGTGKSMLLDLFYRGVHVQRKRRVHFNQFMLEVHMRLQQAKTMQIEQFGRQRHIQLDQSRDVVLQVAHAMAHESHLLCFDEFQVTDVADAFIIRKLFHVLFRRGVVIVATSNTPPKELYQNGTNWDYFVPFLDQLTRHTQTVLIASSKDYRIQCPPIYKSETFLYPLSTATRHQMDTLYHQLLATEATRLVRVPVSKGRVLNLRGSIEKSVCRISFYELCETEKGVTDYKVITETFTIIMLDNVPVLSLNEHDAVRRFVLFVDEIYEHRTRLILSSEAATPREIFCYNEASAGATGNVCHLVAFQDLYVATKRAVSRLYEMQSERYRREHELTRSKRREPRV